jgi:hypothetical protein
MLTYNWRRFLVCCAGVCVLLLFFFPLVHGPFSATHGPTTAFRGRKIFLALLLLILGCSKGLLSRLKIALEPSRYPLRRGEGAFYDAVAAANSAVLRC